MNNTDWISINSISHNNWPKRSWIRSIQYNKDQFLLDDKWDFITFNWVPIRKEWVENDFEVPTFSYESFEEIKSHQQCIWLYEDKKIADSINSAFIPYYTNEHNNQV